MHHSSRWIQARLKVLRHQQGSGLRFCMDPFCVSFRYSRVTIFTSDRLSGKMQRRQVPYKGGCIHCCCINCRFCACTREVAMRFSLLAMARLAFGRLFSLVAATPCSEISSASLLNSLLAEHGNFKQVYRSTSTGSCPARLSEQSSQVQRGHSITGARWSMPL